MMTVGFTVRPPRGQSLVPKDFENHALIVYHLTYQYGDLAVFVAV